MNAAGSREVGDLRHQDGLTVSNLRVDGAPMLQQIDLRVGAGDVVAIAGRAGTSKSILLRSIIGIHPIEQGRIEVEGKDVTPLSPSERAKAGIGYVTQGPLDFASLSVRENLQIGARACGRSPEFAVRDAVDAFPSLGPVLPKTASTLNAGQQRLIAIGRALGTRPKVLLLDEPTASVQISVIDEIAERLRSLASGRDVAILLAEQNLGFAARVATRVLLLHKGRIAGSMRPTEALNDDRLRAEVLGIG